MTQWKCSNCGYILEADTLSDRWPSCKQACTFSDVSCYIPDCGGPQNIDPRLAGKKDGPGNEGEKESGLAIAHFNKRCTHFLADP
jgi:rubredoxin